MEPENLRIRRRTQSTLTKCNAERTLALHDSRSLDFRHPGSLAPGPTALTFSDSFVRGVAIAVAISLAVAVAQSHAAGPNDARAYQ
jgi:hypothetical protein